MLSAERWRAVPLGYLLIAAIIFVLLSVIVDLAVALQNSHLNRDEIIQEIASLHFFSLETLGGLLREIGFAAAIAWAISITIEKLARERDSERTDQSRKLIAQDVFKAVIGSFVPENIRDIAFDTILLAPITRSMMRFDIEIRQLPEQYVALKEKFVRMTYRATFDVTNESPTPTKFNVDLFVDKCPVSELDKEHAIMTVAIGEEKALTAEQIKEGYDFIPDTDGEFRYQWPRSIPGGGKLRVVVRWSSVKGIYDSAIWSTLLPTT